MHTELEIAQKNIVAISTILHHSNLLPFTELLEKVNTFNAAVSQCATFLAEQVIYKVSEAFDDEMESSMEDAKEIIGARFSEILAAQAHNAVSSTSILGQSFCASSFRLSSSTSLSRRLIPAALFLSAMLVSSLHGCTGLLDSNSLNYS